MFKELIKEISEELKINYTLLSKGYIIKLEKDNKCKYIVDSKFDLNGHGIGLILDDKYAFTETVKSFDIACCDHSIFYSPNNYLEHTKGCHTYEDMYNYFHLHNNNIVIKPNNGSKGKDVYHINNQEGIKNIVDKLFIDNSSISFCPYYDILYEYRVTVLDNQVKLIYKKIKPVVTGNGINTIKELFLKLNYEYFKDIDLPNIVLKNGEEYIYNWKFNLSLGATASLDIENNKKEELCNIALEVSTKVGITFANIDIVELKDHTLLVLEANSGVTLHKCLNFIPDGKNIAKEIYKEAIIKMFN